MSSWLISKNTYARVAGVLAGIGSYEPKEGEPVFWIWSKEKNTYFRDEDIAQDVMSLYRYNLISFCEQYGEDISKYFDNRTLKEIDDYSYYFSKARSLYIKARSGDESALNRLNSLFHYTNDFFSGVEYQIEDETCYKEANSIMDSYSRYFAEALSKLIFHENRCWTKFAFFENEKEITDEMYKKIEESYSNGDSLVFKIDNKVYVAEENEKIKKHGTILMVGCQEVDASCFSSDGNYYGDVLSEQKNIVLFDPYKDNPSMVATIYRSNEVISISDCK